MALQCGIVGLPNVGKSTLFNALTSAKALAANYPFATKDPNLGIITVPDARLDALSAIVNPEKMTKYFITALKYKFITAIYLFIYTCKCLSYIF